MRWIVVAAALGLAGVCALDPAAHPSARGRGPAFLMASAPSPVGGAGATAPDEADVGRVGAGGEPAGVTPGSAEENRIPLEAVVVDSATGAPLGRAAARQTEETAAWDVQRGERARLRFVVDPPAGYATEGLPEYSGPVSIFAKRVRAVLPLRREAWVELDVRHARGTPARGLELVRTWLGGAGPAFEEVEEEPLDEAGEIPEELDEIVEEAIEDEGTSLGAYLEPAGRAGRYRLCGVPHLVGERIRFVVASGHRNAYGEVILGGVGEAAERGVVLPAECNRLVETSNGSIVLGGGCGGYRRRDGGHGALVVLVRHSDGRPAGGVGVTAGSERWSASARTDAAGWASLRGLADGEYTVDVREPGFVYVKADVRIVDGATPRVELVEPEGWTARVRVIDAMERPVPFARLRVDPVGPAYVLFEGGVQMLALWTDAQGEAVLPRLPDGPATVQASYGTRDARIELTPATHLGLIRLPEHR